MISIIESAQGRRTGEAINGGVWGEEPPPGYFRGVWAYWHRGDDLWLFGPPQEQRRLNLIFRIYQTIHDSFRFENGSKSIKHIIIINSSVVFHMFQSIFDDVCFHNCRAQSDMHIPLVIS